MHTISIPEFAITRGLATNPPRLIDPVKTAVVAIDFQRFFIDEDQPMGNVHARDVLINANSINAAVRESGGLVIFTQHSMLPPPGADASPDAALDSAVLAPGNQCYDIHSAILRLPTDVTLIKYRSSPLHPKAGTDLEHILDERGIRTIIITGLASNGCCDCLARDAFQHGFDVIFASDATAAMTDEEHNATLLNLAVYYARVMTTAEIVAAVTSTTAE